MTLAITALAVLVISTGLVARTIIHNNRKLARLRAERAAQAGALANRERRVNGALTQLGHDADTLFTRPGGPRP